MPAKSKIGEIASAATKEDFAEQLSSYTTLTADEIKTLFPTKSDREEMVELIRIVKSSADDNTKKAELIEKISNVSGAVLKLVMKFASGI